MPVPAKLVQILGMVGKAEPAYGTTTTLSTTADGIQLQFENRDYPAIKPAYTFDGDLGPSVGNLGTVLRAAKAGKSFTYEAPTRAKGAGAAYSASILPSVDRLLRASGFNAAVTTTSGSESVVYTCSPPGTTYTSLAVNLWSHGKKYDGIGVLCDWAFDAPNGGPPTHRFTLNGYFNADISDAAPPTITYPLTSVQAPLANGVALTMGSFTTAAVVYNVSFQLQRELLPRVALTSAGGHLGFVPRGRMPEMTITMEETALQGSPYHASTGFDPWKLEELGTSIVVAVTFGSTQYNRYTVQFNQAQLIDATPTVVNGVACVELRFRAHTSTPVAGDDITVTFN